MVGQSEFGFPQVLNVPDSRRYWVVRASGGLYRPHFAKAGIAAIGHLDPLKLPASARYEISNEDALESSLAAAVDRETDGSLSVRARVTQSKTFIHDIKNDDWILVPDGPRFMVGRVKSDAFVSQDTIVVDRDQAGRENIEMSFSLRRSVDWAPLAGRRAMSYPMSRTLRANQTVFNVDDHWEAVYHSVAPFFVRNDKLFVSFNINQQDDIDNFSLSKFLLALTEAEVLSDLLSEEPNLALLSQERLSERISELAAQNALTLSTKAQFMSDGDLWVQLAKNKKSRIFMVAIIYSMMFGNSHIGWDGIVDLQTRQKVYELLLNPWEKSGGKNIKKNLGLGMPKTEISQKLIGAGELDLPR